MTEETVLSTDPNYLTPAELQEIANSYATLYPVLDNLLRIMHTTKTRLKRSYVADFSIVNVPNLPSDHIDALRKISKITDICETTSRLIDATNRLTTYLKDRKEIS